VQHKTLPAVFFTLYQAKLDPLVLKPTHKTKGKFKNRDVIGYFFKASDCVIKASGKLKSK